MGFKLLILLAFAVLLNTNCSLVKSHNRDNSQITFDSEVWKSGDNYERCRMVLDLYRHRNAYITGKSEELLIKQFGEPDSRKEKNSRIYWFYELECPRNANPKFAITILNGKGLYGIDDQRGEITVSDNNL